MKISTILDKIDERQLFVPAFQREYVWKRDDAKQLIDSLLKEYPTGTMLTWETRTPPELKGAHRYHEDQGAVRILLDGQQRITTLYMLMRGKLPPYYTIDEIANDTSGLFVNISTLELSYYMQSKMESSPYWRDITDVFQGKVSAFSVNKELTELGIILDVPELDHLNKNINAIQNIKDRDFPEQTVPVKANVREAIEIFYKVNASGVSLTDAELALAQISGFWPQARDLFKKKLAALEKDGFAFKLDFLVYVLLGCLHHIGSDMRKLHGAENDQRLRNVWKRLDEQVLDYVVNLLRSHAYIDHSAEINSPYALVPLIVHCFGRPARNLSDHLSDPEIRKVVKWFYYAQIRARYTSQLPQKLDLDLRTIAELDQPFDRLLGVIEEESRLEIQPYEFVGRAIQHPLFSMVRWYLKSRSAVCLSTGMQLRKNMGPHYELELDHIFPYSKLKRAGYGKGNRVKYALAQEFTNRAILTRIANRTKSDTGAATYLSDVLTKFPKSLEMQCIPGDPDLWKIENYEQFLEVRRALLARKLNEFLAGITSTDVTVAPVTLAELIAEGESSELEFKASLRWSYKEGAPNRILEDVVVKTIAAFGNSTGGTLLIGVEDNGNVVGLEHDFRALNCTGRDGYELHLRNILSKQFGLAVVSSKVQVSFHDVDDKEVCQVDVLPATSAMVVQSKDKGGQDVHTIYVRNGNASNPMSVGELPAFLTERFS